MTRREGYWLAAYCACIGIPSVLLMTHPLAGWIVGVPALVGFWMKATKEGAR